MTIDDLYAVPLEDFVAARDELAKELNAAGDGDEAKRVKSLRKPTATAWTLNRLARERPELIAALADAHAGLRSAGSATALRAASEARMAAIQLIIDAAEGATDAVLKKVRSTLLATATDPAAEEALIAGRLQTELEPGGLGGFDMGIGFTTDRPGPGGQAQVQGSRSKERREAGERQDDQGPGTRRTIAAGGRCGSNRGASLARRGRSRRTAGGVGRRTGRQEAGRRRQGAP